ncbi:hypothetical protein C2G38_2197371 [Gigaspora rosea]|uniref:SUN domain-containing protein n=1 Tax=Gigaspora rosea TaxID=44941 RepID=A0A397UTZ7_9GLOM|nr:hypothetical protein C2G38_2197371 [Gigaspora rosea]
MALDPDDMRRAPKTFEIVGISVDSQEKYDEYFQLGSFDYKLDGPPAQSFEINLQIWVMKAVILKIMGNWGDDELTCLYQVKNITTLFKLSGTTRYETNAAIVDTLKKNFIKAIEKDNWDDEKFKIFLTKSMKYFFIEELRPIIFALLKKYPKRMTEEIYEILHKSCQETGYYTSPIGIKRGLYERNNTIFKEFIYYQFSKYLQKREINLDQRMNDPALKTIIDLIDKNQILFAELQEIPDVAMIFQDPIVYNVLSTQIVEALKKCITESFTRDRFFGPLIKVVEPILPILITTRSSKLV